jgi:hypothetical protein
MQKGVVSSYNNKSNSEVGSRPRVGEWFKKSFWGQYHFIECPFVLENKSMAYFLLIQKDIPTFKLAEKRGILALATENS